MTPVQPLALMYDSATPLLIPVDAQYLAVYANGDYPADLDAVRARFPKARIFTIDVMNTDPVGCGIADVENGDMQPGDVPSWVERRAKAHPGALARVYCNDSTWPAVKAEVAQLPDTLQDRVRYWIAEPNGVSHIPAGAQACQYYWGEDWDESTINVAEFVG